MRLAEGSNLRGGKTFCESQNASKCVFHCENSGFEASHGPDRKVVVRLLTHLVIGDAYFWCYKSTTWGQNSINQRPPWIIFFFVLGDGFLLESYLDRKRGCGAGLGTPQSRAGGSGPSPRCRGCQHPPASAPVSMAIPYRAASMALSHQLRSLQSSLGDPCLKDSSVAHVMSMQQGGSWSISRRCAFRVRMSNSMWSRRTHLLHFETYKEMYLNTRTCCQRLCFKPAFTFESLGLSSSRYPDLWSHLGSCETPLSSRSHLPTAKPTGKRPMHLHNIQPNQDAFITL